MDGNLSSSKVYMTAIQAVRERIAQSGSEGAWLPGGRKMAEELGISHATYRKALKFLEEEGLLLSYPKKGHYIVPDKLRIHKVGVIVGPGAESPFLHHPRELASAIDHLASHGYDTQLIQASFIEHLYDRAKAFGVEGLIWVMPGFNAVNEIMRIYRDEQIPLIVTHSRLNLDSSLPCVLDGRKMMKERVDLLIRRGHKKIAYIGDFEYARTIGLVSWLAAGGLTLTAELCVDNMNGDKDKMNRLIVDANVTGVLSEGGVQTVGDLFTILSDLPDDKQPEVVVSYFSRLSILREMYPKVKLLDVAESSPPNLVLGAAKMMVAHLKHGDPLKTMNLGDML